MVMLHSEAPHTFLNPSTWFVILQTHEEPFRFASLSQVEVSQLWPKWHPFDSLLQPPASVILSPCSVCQRVCVRVFERGFKGVCQCIGVT